MQLIISILVSAIGFLIGAYFLKGVKLKGFHDALILSVVIALLNGTLGWFLEKITLGLLGWGLFQLLLDTIFIMAASFILERFDVDGWVTALLLAIVVLVCNGVVYYVFL